MQKNLEPVSVNAINKCDGERNAFDILWGKKMHLILAL